MMSNASPRRCVRYDASYCEAREKESASDVVGYGMVTRCHQHCGSATDSVHRQSSGRSSCAWEMAREAVCVLENGDFYSRERLVCS